MISRIVDGQAEVLPDLPRAERPYVELVAESLDEAHQLVLAVVFAAVDDGEPRGIVIRVTSLTLLVQAAISELA